MTRINLLPWRDEARKRRRIEFLIAAGVTMAITLLAAVGVHVYIEVGSPLSWRSIDCWRLRFRS